MSTPTAPLHVRLATPADLEAAAHVYTLARPGNPATAQRLHHEDAAQQAAGAYHHRWLALAGEDVVGAAELMEPLGSRHGADAGGVFWMELAVLEDWRGQGLATRLFRTLLQDLQTQRPRTLKAILSEANPIAMRFAQTRGFHEGERFWDRTLNLAAFDAPRHTAVIPAGVSFLNLGEFRAQHPAPLSALHTLYEEARLDLPRAPGETFQPMPENATEDWLSALQPELVTLAVSADNPPRPLALAALEPSGVPGELVVSMTGVARAERGRGMARAVKVASMVAARAAGWQVIRTTNHSTNLPMLRVNDALGFGREPARLGMIREWPA
ncbi:GNAT family N-acetyltransferase [Deinococcus ruber]|uniref:N-acetyltransferase domain-containing protein n=1 Tax=Deinococcus ruber TaxID=1848197 RepID=A0A918F605_9DEIO|nr:GNAT family N-acetyltransferase [Deinococcus ruber]GGR04499.1 hypothetical protein GCM10008957_16690 [Deinococcus ruber]